jgi:hypothetical protein
MGFFDRVSEPVGTSRGPITGETILWPVSAGRSRPPPAITSMETRSLKVISRRLRSARTTAFVAARQIAPEVLALVGDAIDEGRRWPRTPRPAGRALTIADESPQRRTFLEYGFTPPAQGVLHLASELRHTSGQIASRPCRVQPPHVEVDQRRTVVTLVEIQEEISITYIGRQTS